MNKLKVALLFGGCSPEYSVSLQSAHAVWSHMDREKFEPLPVGISPEGDWFRFEGAAEKLLSDTWLNSEDCAPAIISPSPSEHALLTIRDGRVEATRLDAVFPVLHGKNGEDGTVQGAVELSGIPLVGCGVLASALCMDKDRAHRLVRAAGVRTPSSLVLEKECVGEAAAAAAANIGYPLFVKPVRAGSSYGITKVSHEGQLAAAIELALRYDSQVILEEAISGFEVGCAVLGGDSPIVGEVDEIELSQGFFDFTEKYTLKSSSIHVPARISAGKAREVKEKAKLIYRSLGCRGFARVDMFLDSGGEVVFNEVNTIPGFTAHSRFPSMLKAVGMSFEEIITAAIEEAVKK